MPIFYKFDVLQRLKDNGYNTTRLRREKLLAEGVIQSLRDGKPISFTNLEKLCELLHLQPGSIIEYKEVPSKPKTAAEPISTPEAKKDPSEDEPIEG